VTASREVGRGRRQWTRLTALAALACALGAAPAAPQTYVVHSYNVMEGLPAPAVHSLAQDPSGAMWFATRAGIAAYDGVTWTAAPDPSTPPARDYRLLTRDERGVVWGVSHRLGRVLRRSAAGAWEALPDPPRPAGRYLRVTALAVVATAPAAVVAIGCGGGEGVFLWRAGAWIRLGTEAGLPSSVIRGIAAAGDGFFVATAAGLARVSQAGAVAPVALPPGHADELQALAASPGAVQKGGPPTDLWLLGRRFLGRLRGERFGEIARGFDLGPFDADSPAVVLPDPPRAVYCASPRLILRVEPDARSFERLGERNGLASSGAAALLRDHEGNVWLGGTRGADKLVSRRFGSFRQAHGLLADEVTAIAEPRPGELLFGHNTGLTLMRNGAFRRLPFADSDASATAPRVLDLRPDGRGGAWLVAVGRGLGRLEAGGRLEWFEAPRPHAGLESSLLAEPNGSLLVAARSAILRFDGRRWFRTGSEGRFSTYVRRMARGRDGTLYLATATNGLLALRGDRVTELASEEAGARNAYAVHEDDTGLWVGTEAGLFLARGAALVRPASETPRVDEPVYFLSAGAPGTLWLGTDRGVLRWQGGRLERFTPREGLAGWETNRAAGFTDSRGRLWIGTEDGVSVHGGEPDPEPPPAPLVAVAAIDAGSRSFTGGPALELPHRSNSLTFRFRAVSWLDERKVAVRCRLEGLEEDWSAELPPRTREVRYVNLPPGRYRFRVKAANAAGVWSEEVTSAPVTIRPPPWHAWWFRLLAAAGATLAVVGAVRLAVRWRYARRLESEVAERTAALRESESRYRQLFHDASVPKLLVDPATGLVLDANQAGSSLARLAASGGGRGIEQARIPGLQPAVRAAAAGRESRFVARVEGGPGGARELEVRTGPIDLGGQVKVLVHLQDVTERRRLEDERIKASKLESMGLFAGGVAHDFNNMLMSILSHIGVAQQRASRGLDIGGNLQAAEGVLVRASGLTRQLLSFARGGAPERRLARLEPLLRETASLAVAGSRSSCVFELPADLWPAELDPDQIGQVIANLVLNASQAMQGGGVVRILASNVAREELVGLALPGGRYVRFSVVDSGVGIPPELVDVVFDPYFTTKDHGQGLGLASSHAIVRRHGGHIGVDSRVGQGTTVSVYLPAADPGES
jgi:signal transduction histidine kinase